MRPRKIPSYPLTDYAPREIAELGIFVGRFEESIAQRPNRTRVHRHEHFELFLLEGRGTHFNDFEEYPLAGHSMVLVSPGQVHGWRIERELRGKFIGFTAAFFQGAAAGPHPLLQYPFAFGSAAPTLALPAGIGRSTDALLDEIEAEFLTRSSGWLEVSRHLLHVLLTRLARIVPTPAGVDIKATRATEIVRRFRLLVEEKFRTTTALSEYAGRLAVTPGYLNEVVRARTGESAGQLLRQRITLEARRLLLHSSLTVSEIAFHLGFEDASYFARFFRRETNLAPAEFRDAIGEKYRSNLQ